MDSYYNTYYVLIGSGEPPNKQQNTKQRRVRTQRASDATQVVTSVTHQSLPACLCVARACAHFPSLCLLAGIFSDQTAHKRRNVQRSLPEAAPPCAHSPSTPMAPRASPARA